MTKPPLTLDLLLREAEAFADVESRYDEPLLYGVTDGKRIGTYLEHKFRAYLIATYHFPLGNSASGIDFPHLQIDMKVTSFVKPQSSCPYRSARQKIFGLGYGLLIFVYEKFDDHLNQTGRLDMRHSVYVEPNRTADFQMTRGLLEILDRDGNEDDIVGFLMDRNLPVDDIEAANIARAILQQPPTLGYLTISNALQWRLHYQRVIDHADLVSGVVRIR
ncbi:hypothetical protein [uncultured Sphingomonas sp.]|uniref:hypothetical protein n=1 Tax=uncultured Sphingomonas sp. TaxID=158754 RepID=UPI0025F4DA4C|nr:hypothetical protein [uncultured Sphingomonas sp.]